MRTVIFTRLRPDTYGFLAHLLARGVDVRAVIFEGSMNEGLRVKILRVIESVLLWTYHFLFLRGHPTNEFIYVQRFGSVQALLKKRGIPCILVDDHNSQACQAAVREAKTQIVVLFGTRIITPDVLALPSVGTLNIHASMLPKYRGSKADFWLLMDGDHSASGVTIHWVEPTLDTGPIAVQEHIPVDSDNTPAMLRTKAYAMAAILLAETIRRVAAGEKLSVVQPTESQGTLRRPTPEDILAFQRKFPGRKVF